MLARDTFRILKAELAPVLEPLGFSASESKRSTFYRCVSSGVIHLLMPDPLFHRPAFEVWVFPTHPVLVPDFDTRFPDDLPISTGAASKLRGGQGLDIQGSMYPCGSAKQLRAAIPKAIVPALLETAVPYLDRFNDLESVKSVLDESAQAHLRANVEHSND